MKRKRNIILCTILSLCILAIVCIILLGRHSNSQINWNMQGTHLTSDGEILDSMEITVSGQIQHDHEARNVLNLYISLPDSFQFFIPTHEPRLLYSASDEVLSISYYIGSNFCLDTQTAEPTLMHMALCKEMEYIMLYWPEDPGKYLVASTDEAVAPGDILQYFHEFIRMYNEESP